MNVRLMFPDRDFDPAVPPPLNAADLTQDLALHVLFEAMAQGDRFLLDAARQALLQGLTSPGDIAYRQAVLSDCLHHPQVTRDLYAIPLTFLERKRRSWLGVFGRRSSPATMLGSARDVLAMSVDLLRTLRRIAEQHAADFRSEGFRRFFAVIRETLSEAYLDEVDAHLKALKFENGVLISAALGAGNELSAHTLRRPNRQGGNWLRRAFARSQVYTYTLPPRDDHGARALGEIRDRGIWRAAVALAQAADHVEGFFKALRRELAFYIGALNLAERLAALDEPVCMPHIVSPQAARFVCRGLYDPTLALVGGKTVVGNDIRVEGKPLVFITGANQGGKSTFLRSVGIAQMMSQCGLFAPAEALEVGMARGVFTHYRREEDAAMQSGKFDEELQRMSAIVDALSPGSLVLFNESFAATNEREGAEIAGQIVRALLDEGVRTFFVTHSYTLAHTFWTERGAQTCFLRAERKADGSRTFKLRPAEPLHTSFGEDLYRKVFEEAKGGR